jgi:hypothetical protein
MLYADVLPHLAHPWAPRAQIIQTDFFTPVVLQEILYPRWSVDIVDSLLAVRADGIKFVVEHRKFWVSEGSRCGELGL